VAGRDKAPAPSRHEPPAERRRLASAARAGKTPEHELVEAEAQQRRAADVPQRISWLAEDVQPLCEAVIANAARLCAADAAYVLRHDDGWLSLAASTTGSPEFAAYLRAGFPVNRETAVGRAALEKREVQIVDLMAEPDLPPTAAHSSEGIRTVLAMPLLQGDRVLGVIAVCRREVRAFTQQQIEVARAFADPAVIAFENDGLRKELAARDRALGESLDRQSATSEILRVISRSPNDVQPVFETIASAAMRLCEARSAAVFTFDGVLVHLATMVAAEPAAVEAARRLFPRPPDRGMLASRIVLMRDVVAIEDVLLDPDYLYQVGASVGWRSVLGVPLLREGVPIGAITIGVADPGPFPEHQVALLRDFAGQAVIAIENARLFGQVRERTLELTRSVDELRALGEVGQAVSSTLDLETVLRTIVSRATQLADTDGGAIFEYDEAKEEFRLHTADRLPAELIDALGAAPMRKGEGLIGRLAVRGAPAAVPDIADASMYRSRVREILLRHGYRSVLAIPLLREDHLLGGLVVQRRRTGEFSPRVIDLLKTFATQSALAIHNARLFRELGRKGRQLEIASRHKSEFLANMSHELRTPLNAIIGFTRIVMRRSQEQLEPKQFENLEKILSSAQHLLSLINAVLDLAKVESGKIEVAAGPVQLSHLLEDCVRTVEPLVKDGVVMVRDFAEALPSLWSDEEKLRQIVTNLLGNAAKFTAQGSIRVSVCAGGGRVVISVADTGIGIPAEMLDSVFEEFEQVDASSTRAHGGTGLGLAIARRLARLMGGDVQAESAVGGGSCFSLSLPLRCPSASP